jgi:hypothetical protein
MGEMRVVSRRAEEENPRESGHDFIEGSVGEEPFFAEAGRRVTESVIESANGAWMADIERANKVAKELLALKRKRGNA